MRYFMIGIFVLLLLSMILVTNFSKNKLKIILSSLIILITLYFVILSIDMNRVNSFKEPIFCRQINEHSETLYNPSGITYQGLGYQIYIEKQNNQIISITMYMLGRVIAGAIT